MAKLTEAQKNQIQIEYAAGASKISLAKKFGVSDVAIAKLLKKLESSDKPKKFDNVSNKDHAKNIVSKAYEALENSNYEKISPETLLKIIERFSAIYGKEELENYETDAVQKISTPPRSPYGRYRRFYRLITIPLVNLVNFFQKINFSILRVYFWGTFWYNIGVRMNALWLCVRDALSFGKPPLKREVPREIGVLFVKNQSLSQKEIGSYFY